jgi:hypothetical protein
VPEVFCEKGDEDEEIIVLSDPPKIDVIRVPYYGLDVKIIL